MEVVLRGILFHYLEIMGQVYYSEELAAGGFAAASATTAAVMALGTASTGTAIASLSGVAAINATLAAW